MSSPALPTAESRFKSAMQAAQRLTQVDRQSTHIQSQLNSFQIALSQTAKIRL